MDKGFEALITLLCTDATKRADYVIPSLNTQGMEALVTTEEFPSLLEQFSAYADQVYTVLKVDTWKNYIFLKTVLTEILYDGKGYFLPCFGGYVQKDIDGMQKDLKPILIARPKTIKGVNANGEIVDIDISKQIGLASSTPALAYNLDTDTVFEKFLKTLFMNIHRFEEFIKERQRNMHNQVEEKTDELNSGAGEKILRDPYKKNIEEDNKNG